MAVDIRENSTYGFLMLRALLHDGCELIDKPAVHNEVGVPFEGEVVEYDKCIFMVDVVEDGV